MERLCLVAKDKARNLHHKHRHVRKTSNTHFPYRNQMIILLFYKQSTKSSGHTIATIHRRTDNMSASVRPYRRTFRVLLLKTSSCRWTQPSLSPKISKQRQRASCFAQLKQQWNEHQDIHTCMRCFVWLMQVSDHLECALELVTSRQLNQQSLFPKVSKRWHRAPCFVRPKQLMEQVSEQMPTHVALWRTLARDWALRACLLSL